jgi:aminoglycoside phosphotransferase (APT) family kinase protein
MSNAASETKSSVYIGVFANRDLESTRRGLGEWLTSHLPDATSVEVLSLTAPKANGGSSETYFAVLDVRSAGETRQQEYVLRFKPFEPRMFLRENFDEQYRLLTFLAAETDVPVPAIRFYEPDASILGAPFWLMEKVEGDVPPDMPPYTSTGFVFEAPPERRRQVWLNGLEAATKVAKVDVARMPRIVDLKPGESGLEENLRHWTAAMEWACENDPNPLLWKTIDWLWANKPRNETALSWGDCRIGNMIFRDWKCVAVLDWDTITLAGPQLDLAHWLTMEDWLTEGQGLPPLEGIGGREETIAQWEAFMGRPADSLAWHEVLACFRLEINCIRGLARMPEEARAPLLKPDRSTTMTPHLMKALERAGAA